MMKYMSPHTNCPYYDKDAAVCSRKGCLFLYPCILVKASELNNTFKKVTKLRGK